MERERPGGREARRAEVGKGLERKSREAGCESAVMLFSEKVAISSDLLNATGV